MLAKGVQQVNWLQLWLIMAWLLVLIEHVDKFCYVGNVPDADRTSFSSNSKGSAWKVPRLLTYINWEGVLLLCWYLVFRFRHL